MKLVKTILFGFLLTSTAYADGIDSFVVFGSHYDGADGATSALDFSTAQAPKTITFNNNAQLDTAQFKFGTASLLLDGTDDFISCADNDQFTLGASDFTLDCQVRFSATTATHTIMSHWDGPSSNRGWILDYQHADTTLRFVYSTDGVGTTSKAVTWTPVVDTWYYVEVDRSGNNLYFFVDGVQVGTTQDVTGVTIFNSNQVFRMGTINSATPANDFAGWLDEARVSVGVARHTANFTAPTAPYSAGSKNLATLGVG